MLASLFQDSFSSPRTLEDQRLESLRQAHAGIEAHIAAKRRAGIAVGKQELEDLGKVEGAWRRMRSERGVN